MGFKEIYTFLIYRKKTEELSVLPDELYNEFRTYRMSLIQISQQTTWIKAGRNMSSHLRKATTKYRFTVHSLQEKKGLCILSFDYCGTFLILYKCLHYINFYEILSRFALLFWRSGSFISFGLRCLRPATDRGKQPFPRCRLFPPGRGHGN